MDYFHRQKWFSCLFQIDIKNCTLLLLAKMDTVDLYSNQLLPMPHPHAGHAPPSHHSPLPPLSSTLSMPSTTSTQGKQTSTHNFSNLLDIISTFRHHAFIMKTTSLTIYVLNSGILYGYWTGIELIEWILLHGLPNFTGKMNSTFSFPHFILSIHSVKLSFSEFILSIKSMEFSFPEFILSINSAKFSLSEFILFINSVKFSFP